MVRGVDRTLTRIVDPVFGAAVDGFSARRGPVVPPRAGLVRAAPVARQMMAAYGDKAVALLDSWVVEHVDAGDRDGAAFWAQVVLTVRARRGGAGRG